MKRRARWALLSCLLWGGCGDPETFEVSACFHPQSGAYHEIRVYAGGVVGDSASKETNVTLILRTLDGRRRPLRLRTHDFDPFVAEDVPDTLLRRDVPLDADLLLKWLPEPQDARAEEHLPGEAAEMIEVIRAAARGPRTPLPATKHLLRR